LLTELHKLRQHPGEPRRRWFSNRELDLIVWFDDRDTIVAFDLCYGKPQHEHVFRWRPSKPMTHLRVDDGEQRAGHHKMTPVYVADGTYDALATAQRFANASSELDGVIRTFVLQRLAEMEPQ